jgi:2-oxo-hept-3-ene-1,7-dioate hydratase
MGLHLAKLNGDGLERNPDVLENESMPSLAAAQIADLARRHQQARDTAQAISAPTLELPDMTIEDAYAAQRAWMELEVARGRRVIGHKIGLTSQAMQQQMKIGEPDYGFLLDDMVFEDGAELDTSRFIDPRIEVEVAFLLGKRLEGPNVTLFDVLSATEYVTPALELIDARSHRVDPGTGRPRTVCDTISDNAADAGIVTGGRPMRPLDVDMRWIGALLARNGIIEETGVAAGVLNHPANGVAWLARKYAAHGMALEAGQIVLGGSFTRAVIARPGDTFAVDYGPLGTVSVHFV